MLSQHGTVWTADVGRQIRSTLNAEDNELMVLVAAHNFKQEWAFAGDRGTANPTVCTARYGTIPLIRILRGTVYGIVPDWIGP
jgi:hypothetical protein